MIKYIFVTGGVVSSLGKGIAAASLGTLLESRGLKVTLLKLDPYIKAPREVVPGTTMAYAGLRNDDERANLIAYLATLK